MEHLHQTSSLTKLHSTRGASHAQKRRAEGEVPADSQECSKGAKLPSGAARGAVDDLELSESKEYSSDEHSSDSSDEYM